MKKLAIALLWFSGSAAADQVSVAVASNFTAPMQRIGAAFEKDTGHRLALSFAATAKLYAQIRNGAPFEVLLTADNTTAGRLEREALAVEGSRFVYSTGKLALWSAKPGYADDKGEVLRKGTYRYVSIANPTLAPYGAAAVEVLRKLGLLDAVQPKFVQGENIGQAYQFAATGNAELAFVALSQVYKDGRIAEGSAWLVPADLYPPIHQEAVLLDKGRNKAAAQALLTYLKGDRAKAVMRSFGYEL